MNEASSIDFSELPAAVGGFSALYRDYLNDFQKVRHFFASDFRSFQQIVPFDGHRRNGHSRRGVLTTVLTEQNRAFSGSEKTFHNINLLAEETTFAVVTGQQVGIAGGPLYTIYKTITALKLAGKLREIHPGLSFVPVFWLEGEDHDLEEMNSVGVLNQENNPVKITYWPRGKPAVKNVLPVGEIQVDEHIDGFIEELQRALPHSEYKKPLLESLRAAYTPGTTFNRAFAAWMNHLFPDSGIIFISANDPRIKKELAGIFRKEIENFPAVSQLIIQRSAELENGYHAQIKTKAMNLFLYHKGGRYFIEPRENDFSLRGTRHYLTREELLGIVETQPELLSPNVALRPICQDTLLPTVAYVAGPSEVAYFAQLEPVYRYFGLPMPAIFPRISGTIVEERVTRTLEKFELSINELFAPPARLQKKVLELISEVNIEEMFSEARNRINDNLNELKFGLQYIDQTLLGALETTRSKNEANLLQLRDKTVEAQAKRHETALRQLHKASATIYPNDNYQEREFNALQFLNKYGPGFVDRVSSVLRLEDYSHQLLKL
ncbi:MAG TPA: bacillithiol biosynthesis cysteine-adding enzyme BshC [Bacteroidota bacterium]|nr:bacillithiol biosynthesis cysteine-adding enzyme BshC [Bacteroidota bacterium]